ncbi:hypothetical protein Anas_03825, partial [Armadillidium nasatum]
MVDQNYVSADETEVPLGSKLGEDRARSARIRSARLQSARRAPLVSRQESEALSESSLKETPSEHEEEEREENEVKENEEEKNENEEKEIENRDDKTIEPSLNSFENHNRPEHVYEEIPDNYNDNEPIYEEISDDLRPSDVKSIDNIESLKRATSAKDPVIEAPTDIFGNPVDDEKW